MPINLSSCPYKTLVVRSTLNQILSINQSNIFLILQLIYINIYPRRKVCSIEFKNFCRSEGTRTKDYSDSWGNYSHTWRRSDFYFDVFCVWWGLMRCDMTWCDVIWYDVTWCDDMWCDVTWRDVMWCPSCVHVCICVYVSAYVCLCDSMRVCSCTNILMNLTTSTSEAVQYWLIAFIPVLSSIHIYSLCIPDSRSLLPPLLCFFNFFLSPSLAPFSFSFSFFWLSYNAHRSPLSRVLRAQ